MGSYRSPITKATERGRSGSGPCKMPRQRAHRLPSLCPDSFRGRRWRGDGAVWLGAPPSGRLCKKLSIKAGLGYRRQMESGPRPRNARAGPPTSAERAKAGYALGRVCYECRRRDREWKGPRACHLPNRPAYDASQKCLGNSFVRSA